MKLWGIYGRSLVGRALPAMGIYCYWRGHPASRYTARRMCARAGNFIREQYLHLSNLTFAYALLFLCSVSLTGCTTQKPLPPIASTALTLQESGRTSEAITLWQEVMKVCPTDWTAPYNLALIFDNQGEDEKAVVLYLKALDLNPGSGDANTNLALLYLKQGELDTALTHAKQAVETQAGFPHYWHNLGLVYQKRGEFSLAEESYRKTIDSDPNMALANYNLGKLFEERGDPLAALECLDLAVSNQPRMWEAVYSLALIHHKLGDLGLAADFYERALQIDPARGAAKQNIAAVEQANKNQNALEKELAEKHFSTIELAYIYHQKGYLRKAEELYKLALTEKPGDSRAAGNLAHVFFQQYRFRESYLAYEAALKRYPSNKALQEGLEAARAKSH